MVDVALPILARHGVPAVWYLATDFVERGRAFPGGGTAAVVGGGERRGRTRAW